MHGRICAWPGTEAQSESVAGFTDVTSHEQTTRKWFEKWGTNRGLRPAIRSCSTPGDVEGAASAAVDDDQTVAPSLDVVKHFCLAAVDSCQEKRLASRVVKAVSRAQRGRSEITDARSALSARVASRTISRRRPLCTARIQLR